MIGELFRLLYNIDSIILIKKLDTLYSVSQHMVTAYYTSGRYA